MKKVISIYKVVRKGEREGDYEMTMEKGSVKKFNNPFGALVEIKEEIVRKRNTLGLRGRIYLSFKPPYDLELSQDLILEYKPLNEKEIEFILENL